jgi:tetratricopeptide (TPR) repeat protein
MRHFIRTLLACCALAAAGCASTSDPEALEIDVYVQNAQGYVDGGHYEEALSQFRRALTLEPQNTKALLGEAYALLYLGQTSAPSAESRIQEADLKFAALDPGTYGENSWKVDLGKGMVHSRLAELYTRAAEIREGAASRGDPTSAAARDRALSEARRRDGLAEKAFMDVLARTDQPLARDNLAALFYLARSKAMRASDSPGYDEALALFRRYEVQVERSKSMWRESARTDPVNAAYFEERLRGAERQEVALRDIVANIHFKRQDHAASLAELSRIIALRPDHAPAYLNRARNAEELGRYGEAADDYRQFLSLTDDPPTAESVLRASERMHECELRVKTPQ